MSFKPLFGTPLKRDHWAARDLAACWLLNENTGRYVWDATGNGNDGICTNMADPPTSTSGWGPGPHGGALAFDGSDDYIEIPFSTKLPQTDNFSFLFAGIFSSNESANNLRLFDNDYKAGVGGGISILQGAAAAGKNKIFLSESGVAVDSVSNVAIQLDVPIKICVTKSGSARKIYFDGGNDVTVNVSERTFTQTGSNPLIGKFGPTTGAIGYLSARLGHVYVANRALSAEEVAYLHAFPYCMFEEEAFPAWMIGRAFKPAWARGANSLIHRMAA